MDQEHIAEDLEVEAHNRIRALRGVGQEHYYACIQELDTEAVVHNNVLGMEAEDQDHTRNGCSDLDSLLEAAHESEEAHCCTSVRRLGHGGDPHCGVGVEVATVCAAGLASSE